MDVCFVDQLNRAATRGIAKDDRRWDRRNDQRRQATALSPLAALTKKEPRPPSVFPEGSSRGGPVRA